jgi:hypothetical protein
MKKAVITWLVFGMIPGLVSCATSRPLALGTVGPGASKRVEPIPTGFLKVYSAAEDHKDGDVHYYPHSGYQIYSMDGKPVKKVTNAISIHDEDPTLVEIPAGNHTILARAEHYGMVKVGIVIEPGQLTIVQLEHNNALRYDFSKTNANLVRLPNGSVVGWRAERSQQTNAVGTAQVK